MNRTRRVTFHCFAAFCCTIALATLLASTIGCGQSGAEYKTAPVKGKVVYDGKAVEAGTITLRPVQAAGSTATGVTGKAASAELKSDGTFILTTYKENDGAVVGTHEVIFAPKMVAATSYDEKVSESPYTGLMPKEKQVEIKAGQNDITIELVKP